MTKCLLPLIFLFFGCNESKQGNVQFKSLYPGLIIHGFIQSIADENPNNDFITIDIRTFGDSIILAIADSYPDLTIATPNNYMFIKGYKVFFMGNCDNPILYMNKAKMQTAELGKEGKTYLLKNNPHLIVVEPKEWLFYFKKDSLINFTPKVEILNYVEL